MFAKRPVGLFFTVMALAFGLVLISGRDSPAAEPPQAPALPPVPEVQMVNIDENGGLDPTDLAAVLLKMAADKPTDIFIFAHGWLNVELQAKQSYDRMRDQMRSVADAHKLRPAGFQPLLIGIHWPSTDFDRQFQDFDQHVTAKLGTPGSPVLDDPETNRVIAGALTGITSPEGTSARTMAGEGPIRRFRDILNRSKTTARNDAIKEAYRLFQQQSPPLARSMEGADSSEFLDLLQGKLTDLEGRTADVASVTQVYTFWKMRRRARTIGNGGVHRLIATLQTAGLDTTSIRLIGHSFGCKVVMAAITGEEALPRPVQSVVLLEGAISNQSFDPDIAGLGREGPYHIALDPRVVAGPIASTSSKFDEANSKWFPQASLLGRQLGELEDPIRADVLLKLRATRSKADFDALFDALGGNTQGSEMKDVGASYTFGPRSRLFRVNGDKFIVGGHPPAGAHSQIFNPQVAWLIWSAVLDGRIRAH